MFNYVIIHSEGENYTFLEGGEIIESLKRNSGRTTS